MLTNYSHQFQSDTVKGFERQIINSVQDIAKIISGNTNRVLRQKRPFKYSYNKSFTLQKLKSTTSALKVPSNNLKDSS